MTGSELKSALNLNKFGYVYLQKVLGLAIKVYIISINSRYPNSFLSSSKLRKTKVGRILFTSGLGEQKIGLSPAIDLDLFHGEIHPRSLIFVRDLGGDNYINYSLYEAKLNKKLIREKISEISILDHLFSKYGEHTTAIAVSLLLQYILKNEKKNFSNEEIIILQTISDITTAKKKIYRGIGIDTKERSKYEVGSVVESMPYKYYDGWTANPKIALSFAEKYKHIKGRGIILQSFLPKRFIDVFGVCQHLTFLYQEAEKQNDLKILDFFQNIPFFQNRKTLQTALNFAKKEKEILIFDPISAIIIESL